MASSKIETAVKRLGTEIINCREKCDGVEDKQEAGYYPRAFFLDPEDAPRIEVAVIGENPGNSSCLEREFYKVLAERGETKFATFEDCQRVWRSIGMEHDYYQRPKHLLQELGLSLNGVLWAEVVFCEKSSSATTIPEKTFERCSRSFLARIGGLVSERRHVLCLGSTAFRYVRKLPRSHRWKIIGVYHPTGSRVLANYFKKENGKKVSERKLKPEILEKFRNLETSQESYACRIKPDGIELV